jgi:hypothetical protein
MQSASRWVEVVEYPADRQVKWAGANLPVGRTYVRLGSKKGAAVRIRFSWPVR